MKHLKHRSASLSALASALLLAACAGGTGANPSASATAAASEKPCIASGDEMAINSQLIGAGDEAVLCPSAIFALTAPVVFTGRGQRVYTQGNPTDDTRATLIVKSDAITNAVSLLDVSDAQLTNVIVDGNREELGYKEGDALVLAGGTASGQVVADTVVRNTRSWSSMHIFEGNGCGNATIERNIIGPAGTSKEWADGISLACTDSIVRDNTIFDATDGAIVVFVGRTRRSPGTAAPGQEAEAERHAGRLVDVLEYEAHERMALAALTALEDAARGLRRAVRTETGLAISVGGATSVTSAPIFTSAKERERATREWSTSPTIATFRPSRRPRRSRIV